MSGVPYVFGNATTSIPLSNLDANFNTPITLGNTTVGLGNTVTTLGNLTLQNATLQSLAAPMAEAEGGTGSSIGGMYGFANRIINGDMRIDQRNSGGSVTPTITSVYTLDRWLSVTAQASKISVQQNAGSVTPPVGFTNYLGVTSLSAYSVLKGDYFTITQYVEGFNTADLAWGTANAKPITLSFQVYSSLTGTFGGSIRNSSANRSYPFTYSIPVANTWTTISLNINGDTSGAWVGATNGVGLGVFFGLGAGSTLSGTAGTWASANYLSATGAVSVVGTNAATFFVTGVDLRKGTYTTAPAWDFRDYGRELILCQRYYEVGNIVSQTSIGATYLYSYTVTKRATPTMTATPNTGSGVVLTPITTIANPKAYSFDQTVANSIYSYTAWTASAEL